MDVITKEKAKELGLTRYFTGKPCRHGHISRRNVSDYSCVECRVINDKAFHEANKEILNQKAKARYQENREERAQKQSEWYWSNRDSILARQSQRRALTADEKNAKQRAKFHDQREMLAGRPRPELCEICGDPEISTGRNGATRPLSFDHDHKTGKFRGWICNCCNTVIGWSKDCPGTLRKLAEYLETHERRIVA